MMSPSRFVLIYAIPGPDVNSVGMKEREAHLPCVLRSTLNGEHSIHDLLRAGS